METKRDKNNNIILYLLTFMLVALISVPGTKASFYEDGEPSDNNLFTALSLDLELESEDDDFSPSESLYPGTKSTNIYKVKNAGTLPFYYGLKIDQDENNSDSCSEMNIKVEYESEVLFDGSILDFNIQYDNSDEFFDHMELDINNEHQYDFEVYIPIYADEDLSDETCSFKLTSFAWQKQYIPYKGYYDEEDDDFTLETLNWSEENECLAGQVFLIGDEEDENSDNPVDELNWPGAFGSFPDFADPFSVGLASDSEFPWNSNYNSDYAKNVDVEFYAPTTATIAKLTLSWSPGKSGQEQKEIFLDGESIGKTNKYTGVSVDGWWENMERFEDEFIFELSQGPHALKFTQLEGDGTLWDYVELEIFECQGQILPEAASISRFSPEEDNISNDSVNEESNDDENKDRDNDYNDNENTDSNNEVEENNESGDESDENGNGNESNDSENSDDENNTENDTEETDNNEKSIEESGNNDETQNLEDGSEVSESDNLEGGTDESL